MTEETCNPHKPEKIFYQQFGR